MKIWLIVFLLFGMAVAQWNNWADAADVRSNLMKAQGEGKIYFSQFHIYDARSENDIYSSKLKKITDEDLYIYGLDFYYASGTYFPAVYKEQNKKHIIDIVKKMWRENKAIPSFSWHLENPYVPSSFGEYMGCRYRKSVKFPEYPVEHQYVIKEILNGGGDSCGFGRFKSNDEHFKAFANPAEWFDARIEEIALLINKFVDDAGFPIPIIFRLWHELEDDWMWWGKNSVSADDYKAFFVLTEKKIKSLASKAQILWGYCPDSYLDSEQSFMSRYPGDDYVDIIGYDDYQIGHPERKKRELLYARMVSNIAKKHNKIAAIFETANKRNKTADNFFVDYLEPIIRDSLVHFGLVQMWGSGKFENEKQYADRKLFLNRDYILKVK